MLHKKLKNHSLQRHLAVSLLVLALIPLIALSLSVWLQVTEVSDRSIATVRKTLSGFAVSLQESVFEQKEKIEQAAVSIRTLDALVLDSSAASEEFLSHFLYSASLRFSASIFTDNRDQLRGFSADISESTARDILKQVQAMWAYRDSKRQEETSISELYSRNGRFYLTIISPVYSQRYSGALICEIAVSDLIEEMAATELPTGTKITVSDPDKREIVTFGQVESSAPILTRLTIPTLGWHLSYYTPKAEILSRAYFTASAGLLVIVLVVGAVFITGSRHLGELSDFFEEISQRIRQISTGNYTPRTTPSSFNQMPEAHAILQEFEKMSDNLEQSRAEIHRINANLENNVRIRTAQLRQTNQELSAITKLLFPITGELRSGNVFTRAFSKLSQANHFDTIRITPEPVTESETAFSTKLPNGDFLSVSKEKGLSRKDRDAVARFAGFLGVVIENEILLHKTRNQHATLSALFSSMSEGFAIFNARNEQIFINSRLTGILKLSQEGRKILQKLQTGTVEAESLGLFGDALRDKDRAYVWKPDTFTGKEYRFDIRSIRVELSDGPGSALIVRDITQEFETNRLKDDVIALVSHELNNPISTLILGQETLRDKSDRLPADMQAAILDNLIAETYRLKEFVRDWLDISMLSNGMIPCSRAPLDLVAHLEDTTSRWLETHQVALEFNPPADGIIISGDDKRLSQIFINLLENAFRYNDKPEKKISIRIDPAPKGYVSVFFSDNGIGIQPGNLERIFDRFYRSEDARKFAFSGSGLGLAICRGIAQAHDGTLRVTHSEPGKGSEFCLTLPAGD